MGLCKKEQYTDAEKEELRKEKHYDEHKMTLAEIEQRFQTSFTKGLSKKTAADLLEKNGENKLKPPPQDPWWLKLLCEVFGGKFNLLLWFGSILCFIAFTIQQSADNLYLGIVLAVVVTITGLFSYYQNSKSDDLMASFASMMPPEISVLRDGEYGSLEAQKLVVGDVVSLVGGDLIPADIVIFECSDNMCVDNSSLTGEPEPLKRKPIKTNEDFKETANLAFFGTSIPEGSCKAIVIRCAEDTYIGTVAALTMSEGNDQTPINHEIHLFINMISIIALILGVTFFFINLSFGADIISNLVFVIGIIVANVPEGLLATVTVCLTLTANRMHTKKVMVKNLEGVETLGSTSCICSDKTGTLTQNIMTCSHVVYGDADKFDTKEAGSSLTNGNISFDPESPAFKKLQRCATLNNTSFFDAASKKDEQGNAVPFKEMVVQGDGSTIEKVAWESVGNASECAFIKLLQPYRDVEEMRVNNPDVFKIPFNSRNKYQVHIVTQEEFNAPDSTDSKLNKGNRVVTMKGAPERILARCTTAWKGDKEVPMTPELIEEINTLNQNLAEQGLRVLSFAEKELPYNVYGPDYNFNDGSEGEYETVNFPVGQEDGPKVDPKSKEGLCYIGMMALVDPPRPAVPSAVSKCKTAGIKVIMVTGDHPDTAEAISYSVGILWSDTKKRINKRNKELKLEPDMPGYVNPLDAEAIVVPGWEIDALTEEMWENVLDHPQIVFARTSPQQKLVIVEHCQQFGHIVAVTGDGVNDSPALKKADIGVAMGITGSEVSKQAADMILLDDNFASIVAGVEEGRLIFDNLKKSICYTLTSNIPEISPFLCYVLVQTPLPLSTILILGIDLGTDMIPAISMAYERAEADIMMRPPRNSKVDRLVTKKLICFAYLQIGIIQAAAGFYSWMVVLNDYGFPPHVLVGLGKADYFNKYPLFCQFNGGQWVDAQGNIYFTPQGATVDPSTTGPTRRYAFWDRGDGGFLSKCAYPVKSYQKASGSDEDENGNWIDKFDIMSKIGTDDKIVVTIEAIVALEENNFYEYLPFRGRMSPFWNNDWQYYDTQKDSNGEFAGGPLRTNVLKTTFFTYQTTGLYSVCGADAGLADPNSSAEKYIKSSWEEAYGNEFNSWEGTVLDGTCTGTFKASVWPEAQFCNGQGQGDNACSDALETSRHNVFYCDDACSFECMEAADTATTSTYAEGKRQCSNIGSRMIQFEALRHSQGAYFISIVVVQWADLLICKTRWLSIRDQGMINSFMNFGLFFETILGACLCYVGWIQPALLTRNLRLTHWFPAIPFSILIFVYDETRKYLMRSTSPEVTDASTGQVKRLAGWLERNTYY